jgi:hypothetical protein
MSGCEHTGAAAGPTCREGRGGSEARLLGVDYQRLITRLAVAAQGLYCGPTS